MTIEDDGYIEHLETENAAMKALLAEIRPMLNRNGFRDEVQRIDAFLVGYETPTKSS